MVEPRHIAVNAYRCRRGGQFPPDVFGKLCSLDAPPAGRAVCGLQWGHSDPGESVSLHQDRDICFHRCNGQRNLCSTSPSKNTE